MVRVKVYDLRAGDRVSFSTVNGAVIEVESVDPLVARVVVGDHLYAEGALVGEELAQRRSVYLISSVSRLVE